MVKAYSIVGADIGEFEPVFAKAGEDAKRWADQNNHNFNRIGALPYLSCALINGFALGGGLEFALAYDFRVISGTAKVAAGGSPWADPRLGRHGSPAKNDRPTDRNAMDYFRVQGASC